MDGDNPFSAVLDGLRALDADMRGHLCEKCGKPTGGIAFGGESRAESGLCTCESIIMEESNAQRIQDPGNTAGSGTQIGEGSG
jgi:hypothetical protein